MIVKGVSGKVVELYSGYFQENKKLDLTKLRRQRRFNLIVFLRMQFFSYNFNSLFLVKLKIDATFMTNLPAGC